MALDFDPEKSRRNARDRGLSFERAEDFDWLSAKIAQDRRRNDGEDRFVALGMLDGRLPPQRASLRDLAPL